MKRFQKERDMKCGALAMVVMALAATSASAGQAGGGNKAKLQTPSLLTEKAPDTFKAKFDTSKGIIVIEVHRDWAPLGADRFYNLVKNGFYDSKVHVEKELDPNSQQPRKGWPIQIEMFDLRQPARKRLPGQIAGFVGFTDQSQQGIEKPILIEDDQLPVSATIAGARPAQQGRLPRGFRVRLHSFDARRLIL